MATSSNAFFFISIAFFCCDCGYYGVAGVNSEVYSRNDLMVHNGIPLETKSENISREWKQEDLKQDQEAEINEDNNINIENRNIDLTNSENQAKEASSTTDMYLENINENSLNENNDYRSFSIENDTDTHRYNNIEENSENTELLSTGNKNKQNTALEDIAKTKESKIQKKEVKTQKQEAKKERRKQEKDAKTQEAEEKKNGEKERGQKNIKNHKKGDIKEFDYLQGEESIKSDQEQQDETDHEIDQYTSTPSNKMSSFTSVNGEETNLLALNDADDERNKYAMKDRLPAKSEFDQKELENSELKGVTNQMNSGKKNEKKENGEMMNTDVMEKAVSEIDVPIINRDISEIMENESTKKTDNMIQNNIKQESIEDEKKSEDQDETFEHEGEQNEEQQNISREIYENSNKTNKDSSKMHENIDEHFPGEKNRRYLDEKDEQKMVSPNEKTVEDDEILKRERTSEESNKKQNEDAKELNNDSKNINNKKDIAGEGENIVKEDDNGISSDPRVGMCTEEELIKLDQHFSENPGSCPAYSCLDEQSLVFAEKIKEMYPNEYEEYQIAELSGLFSACYCRCPMMKCEMKYIMDNGSQNCKNATIDYCNSSNNRFVQRCTLAAQQLPKIYDIHVDSAGFTTPCQVCNADIYGGDVNQVPQAQNEAEGLTGSLLVEGAALPSYLSFSPFIIMFSLLSSFLSL